MTKLIATYAEFWPYYLREHAQGLTRTLHALGTGIALLFLVMGILVGPWWLIFLGIFAGYGFAWGSHLLVERNRPATFRYPLWSLFSDLRMAWLMVTGGLAAELEKANQGSEPPR